MARYSVKEIYYSIQGEGAHTGRPAVFLRFTGCNLWSGREADRSTAACQFCDTDFVGTDGPGGGRFESSEELAEAVTKVWPVESRVAKYVVCTGGEPLLQLDLAAIKALHAVGCIVAVETNGTLAVPEGIDWLCVSPKVGADLRVTRGDELKLVYPQTDDDPAQYEALAFSHFYLQPMDGPNVEANTRQTIAYCLAHPQWRLSIQTQKRIGLR
ncbi:MAG: 7-carboxy-7-deazaguanine synthase [Planctomycetaceae bacterium]|nr:7-carboxy-7-deazaguanine synthase [Planctomycetaceae bacterium]